MYLGVGGCVACDFVVREQYELLKRIGAIEVPAVLDPVFMNPQAWESLSIKHVFG